MKGEVFARKSRIYKSTSKTHEALKRLQFVHRRLKRTVLLENQVNKGARENAGKEETERKQEGGE